MLPDYYRILQLDKSATSEEIKKNFRELALKHHPDVSHHKNAHEKFIEINEAYQILSNADKRKKYDRLITRQLADQTEEQQINNDLRNWAETVRQKAQQKAKQKYNEYIKEFDCFFDDRNKADGKPYYYHMHTISGFKGGVGPTGSIKSKNVSIIIPRSKLARRNHNIGFSIKTVALCLAVLYAILFKITLIGEWLGFFSILLGGGILCHLFYFFTKTKSLFYYARKYPAVEQYLKAGYNSGFHAAISTSPFGLIFHLVKWLF